MHSLSAYSSGSGSFHSRHYDESSSSLSPQNDLSDTSSFGTASSATLHPAQDLYPQNVLDDNSFSPAFSKCLDKLDGCVQDVPIPNSSTPDLRSRSSSSSSLSAPDMHSPKTPLQDSFISALNRKLEALLKEGHLDQKFRPRYTDFLTDTEDDDFSKGRPYSRSHLGISTGRSDHIPTPKAEALGLLKRKRDGSSSIYDDLESETDSTRGDSENNVRSSAPNTKKLKETAFSYAVCKTASARRAHSLSACASFATASGGLVPTQPVSPADWSEASNSNVLLPMLIPTPDFTSIFRPPLTADDAAEQRLKALLKNEEERRLFDGFERGVNLIFDKKISQEEVNTFLGIDESFRRKVIQWILLVTPSKKLRVGQLRDQLRSGPETRFLAIMLFSRYFMRVGDAMPIPNAKETPLMRLGRQRITWDVAVSCLALSVKFHRDFLEPLSPILSKEFLVIAPHPMSHDDFEVSQKDVLQALDYRLREPTPGPYLEEIWNSLPTMRKVLGFTDGREVAQMNAWHRLNVAAVASEMLQFPMSLLASAAFIEGAIEALVALYESDLESRVHRELTDDEEVSLEDRAATAFADVIEDIKDLMDIRPEDLKSCRDFLQKAMECT